MTGTGFWSRRAAILAGVSAAALVASGRVTAQETGESGSRPFSFDLLTEEMRALAAEPYPEPVKPEGFLGDLSYDDYRLIRFDPDAARWQEAGERFRVHAFHTGWLFGEPVKLFEVRDGMASEMVFTTDDFIYQEGLAGRVPEHADLPGVAGFRLHTPLNRPDIFDELVAFLGASYFRALGRGNAYGLSARGLALNTATERPEEFPRFSRFWLERPEPGAETVTVYAALEGPNVTGAYRFAIAPGADTTMDVTARVFLRAGGDVAEAGIAPLTSMFLFAETNRGAFDDFRPSVHDSDGLKIVRADGDVLWRPLNNPAEVATSYFGEASPRAFGLMQRDRAFDSYQDITSHYERRPSALVEPVGDWGAGAVKLVEIPTELEANDNIVAYWVPDGGLPAEGMLEFEYRLHWGMLREDPGSEVAHVAETRSGAGGVSGVEAAENTRKFVIDFEGGLLANLPAEIAHPAPGTESVLEPVVTATGGEIQGVTLDRLPEGGRWRLVIDVMAEDGAVVELVAHVAGFGRKLTETWLYQWRNT